MNPAVASVAQRRDIDKGTKGALSVLNVKTK
jgi:hypothetical protein